MAKRNADRRIERRPHGRSLPDSELILGSEDASLLDIVDNVLNKGVVLTGDVTIGLAQVDLVYARLSLLLCAADRVLPHETGDFLERHSRRHTLRDRIASSRGAAIARTDIRGPERRRKA